MPTFIDMSNLTKRSTLTGAEEFQVSATEKVTSQQIAELALSQKLPSFANINSGKPSITANSTLLYALQALYKLSSANGKVLPISDGVNKFGNVVYSGTDAVGILFDVKASKYYTRSGSTTTSSNTDAQWITWLQAGNAYEMSGGSGVADPIVIEDFAAVSELPNWPSLKLGLVIPFTTTGDVNNKPSGTDTSYTGIMVVTEATQGMINVMAWGDNSGACFWGVIDSGSISVTWNNNRLSIAKGTLSAFTETVITSYFYEMSDGDLMPFSTPQSTKTTANQFPANGAWSGFITIGAQSGINILAFKAAGTTNPEVYVGHCSGSTTQWTAVGGGGGDVIMQDLTEGLEYLIPDSLEKLVPFAINNGSSQVPSIFEGQNIDGFGFLKKMSDYWSIALATFAEDAGGGNPHTYMGLVDNQGGGTDWHIIPNFENGSLIPGYTPITVQNHDIAVTNNTTAVINLTKNTSLLSNRPLFAEVEVLSAAVNGTQRTKAPLTFFYTRNNQTVCDIVSRELGGSGGSIIGSIRLILGTVNASSLIFQVKSSNLANAGDIVRVKAVYAQLY